MRRWTIRTGVSMGDAIEARTVAIPGADGDGIEAYLARPTEATAMGGVVVIHHMPGYDAGHKEITRRLATRSAARRCARTCIRARLLAPTPTTLPPPPAPGVECRPTGSWVTSRAASTLSGPLLGLFGNEDAHPSPADVDELDRRLTELGKVHEFHRYDDAARLLGCGQAQLSPRRGEQFHRGHGWVEGGLIAVVGDDVEDPLDRRRDLHPSGDVDHGQHGGAAGPVTK